MRSLKFINGKHVVIQITLNVASKCNCPALPTSALLPTFRSGCCIPGFQASVQPYRVTEDSKTSFFPEAVTGVLDNTLHDLNGS